MNGFEKAIAKYNGEGLHSSDIETIQVNIGLKCNLECVHCHVVSSPRRKEMMDWETMEHVIAAAEKTNAKLVDITGGAPEMHPQFPSVCEDGSGKRVPCLGENQPHYFT